MEEAPRVAQAYKDWHDWGLEILGIDDDSDPAALHKFLQAHPEATWPQFFSPGVSSMNKLLYRLKVPGIPTTYVIDRNGYLRVIQTGGFPDFVIWQLLSEKAEDPPSTMPSHILKETGIGA